MTEQDDLKAQKRMQVILEHLAGRMNATDAARELNVSRKTFYEWLERAREGMFRALQDRAGGRPPLPVDPQKDALLDELATLEKERTVLAARLRIQEAVRSVLEGKAECKKKP